MLAGSESIMRFFDFDKELWEKTLVLKLFFCQPLKNAEEGSVPQALIEVLPKSHQKGVDWVAKVMCSVGSSTTFVGLWVWI